MMATFGRPPLTEEAAKAEAMRILEIALALRQGRTSHLKKLGVTENRARWLVQKRHRGPIGYWIGDSLDGVGDSLAKKFQPRNRAMRAGQIALDLSLSGLTATEAVTWAAESTNSDVRHVWRALKRAKLDEEAASVRMARMGFFCQELPVIRGD